MSIETLLTLALAAGILLAAALIRLVVLTLLSLGLRLAGRDRAWVHPFRTARTGSGTAPRRAPLRPRVGHGFAAARRTVVPGVRAGAATTVAVLVFVAATLAGWATVIGRELGHGGRGAAGWLRPRLSAAYSEARRGLRMAGAWIRPRIVVVLATLQHLVRLGRERFSEWTDRRAEDRQSRAGEDPIEAGPAPQARVIDLNKDWDPLTDPLPDVEEERVTTRL